MADTTLSQARKLLGAYMAELTYRTVHVMGLLGHMHCGLAPFVEMVDGTAPAVEKSGR